MPTMVTCYLNVYANNVTLLPMYVKCGCIIMLVPRGLILGFRVGPSWFLLVRVRCFQVVICNIYNFPLSDQFFSMMFNSKNCCWLLSHKALKILKSKSLLGMPIMVICYFFCMPTMFLHYLCVSKVPVIYSHVEVW